MASNTLLFLVFFASIVTVILSIPQVHLAVQPAQPQPPQDSEVPKPEASADSNVLVADNVPHFNPNPRTFGSLFNLSAYLVGAPNDSAALNFIPLITILSALG